MILSIIYQDHDYEPKNIFVESDKLDPTNPVDNAIIEALKKGEDSVFIEADDWENRDGPFKGHEPELSDGCQIPAPCKEFSVTIDYGC